MVVELADGTRFEGVISHYRNEIWIQMTAACAAAQMLNLIDKTKTKRIIQHLAASDVIYTGFTGFGEVRIREDGDALFYLVGDENSTIEKKWLVEDVYLPEELRKDNIQNGSEQDVGSGGDHLDTAQDSEPADGPDQDNRGETAGSD